MEIDQLDVDFGSRVRVQSTSQDEPKSYHERIEREWKVVERVKVALGCHGHVVKVDGMSCKKMLGLGQDLDRLDPVEGQA